MPLIKDCPLCKAKSANHGFTIVNGGYFFYHGETCRYYEGDKGRVYRSHLEMFKAEVMPHVPKDKANQTWVQARLADLSNQPRKAKKLYEQWRKFYD